MGEVFLYRYDYFLQQLLREAQSALTFTTYTTFAIDAAFTALNASEMGHSLLG